MADSGSHDLFDTTSRYGWILAWLFGALAVFLVVSGQALLPSTDSYYHLKMARLLPCIGFTHEFPWLAWTIFRDHFVSHHFGFHILLAPFVWISERLTGDLVAGGKAAVVVSMGTTAMLFFLVLRALRVPHPLFWTCLLGCLPWHFWLRLCYVRAPLAALPLLLLTVLLFIRERPLWLAVAAYAFVTVYLGAVVALLVPCAMLGGRIMTLSCTEKTWRMLIAFFLGFAIGIVASPYFPGNLPFLKIQMFVAGLGAEEDVPSEWLPFNAWTLLKMSAPLAVIWLCALIVRLRQVRPLDGTSLGILLLNLTLFALTLKSRRFMEYWPVFALLNAADLARVSWPDFVTAFTGNERFSRTASALAPVAAIALSLPGLLYTRAHVQPFHNQMALKPAAEFLTTHSPARSLVLTDDWDVFPVLFYYDDHNTYAVGLDPVFTKIRYPELWERYKLITQGNAPANLPPLFMHSKRNQATLDDIGDVFLAQYVLVQEDHAKLFRQLLDRPDRFTAIYPPGFERGKIQPVVAIFQVLPAAKTP